MAYPWYSRLENSAVLSQGDLIPNCPILKAPIILEESATPEVEVILQDCVILSQTCDLTHGKVEIVLVCPYYTLSTFIENLPPDQQSRKGREKAIDNLKKGHFPSYHLINKSEDFEEISDYLVVDFRNVYGVHIESLSSLSLKLKSRFSLLPPYREHLSQSFARYFMRVGLPQDIDVQGYS